jgi:hypothetical protein
MVEKFFSLLFLDNFAIFSGQVRGYRAGLEDGIMQEGEYP